jgi:hypothetical protein
METTKLNKTINEIFEDSYVIPLYQRNFAWGEQQIHQLIQDIYDASQQGENIKYYIGTLVVLKRHNGVYEVIDGQQRLTVLSLLIRILDIKKELKLSYDSRPEVEEFLREFYNNIEYKSCDPKTYNLSNAIECINHSKVIKSDDKTVQFHEIKDDLGKFLSSNVVLFRVDIPEDTDVASYFEIMNNRGEQLQKHEIFKAKLMNKLDPMFHNEFNLIWTACSNMDNHIQACFNIDKRKDYFGEDYVDFCFKGFTSNVNEGNEKISRNNGYSINDILDGKTTYNVVNTGDKETTDKYNSIIDFPNFLMHVLKLYMELKKIDEVVPLDEKYLLNINIDKIESNKFINLLFRCRVLFDRYIIKTITTNNDDEFRWTLRYLKKTINKGKKGEYFSYDESATFKGNLQDMVIKAQSMLQVTFRQRIYKNWLYETLKFLNNKNEIDINADDLLNFHNEWMCKYYEGCNVESLLCLGTKTPHFLLNFIDYLYWIKAKSNQHLRDNVVIKDFIFKYWNSVEHHLSVNKATERNRGERPEWVDQIGNLFLISKNANSRLSDRDVQEKVKSYTDANMGPNRQIIYNQTSHNHYEWSEKEISSHTEEIKTLLAESKIIMQNLINTLN